MAENTPEIQTEESGNKTMTYVIIAVLAALIIAIVAQNMESIELEFLMFNFKAPLIVLIGVSFGIGYLMAFLFGRGKQKELKKQLKKASK